METSENAELLALQRIDDTCVKLQEQGKYLEALECMERGLVLRQHFFGADSDEVWRACKTVGEMCNLLAMTYLQQEDFGMVLELLKKAEILTERDEAGRAVTFNNLACYYRRQGKLHAALSYLQKALRIEARLEHVDNPADTHLNMCAVLSQLGRHAGALEHSQSALILLQEELFSGAMAGGNDGSQMAQKVDRIAVLAIAYHNIGVEQEFLKRHEQSLHSYRKGVDIAETHLGNDHGITITLRNSLLAAQRVLAQKPGRGVGDRARMSSMPKGKQKKMPRHAKGAKTSPSKNEEERWEHITGAYGELPGVEPVVSKPPKGQARQRGGQAQPSMEAMEQQMPQMSMTDEQLMVPVDDGAASPGAGTDDTGVDLDSLVEMVTPRRAALAAEEEAEGGKVPEDKETKE
jgi:tetratricopeptide (TPR) repeat protein